VGTEKAFCPKDVNEPLLSLSSEGGRDYFDSASVKCLAREGFQSNETSKDLFEK
jgi:hypothetical protein